MTKEKKEEEPVKSSDDDVKELKNKVALLEENLKGQAAVNQMLRDLSKLSSNSDFIKDNPELAEDVQEDVLTRIVAQPNVPVQKHFETVVKKMTKISKKVGDRYVKGKLKDEEKTKGERSKGTMEALLPDRKITAADIKSGEAKRMLAAAIERE